MGNAFIAFLVALGVGGWVYAKMMKTSGGLTKNALTVAGVVAGILFLILFSAMNMLTN